MLLDHRVSGGGIIARPRTLNNDGDARNTRLAAWSPQTACVRTLDHRSQSPCQKQRYGIASLTLQQAFAVRSFSGLRPYRTVENRLHGVREARWPKAARRCTPDEPVVSRHPASSGHSLRPPGDYASTLSRCWGQFRLDSGFGDSNGPSEAFLAPLGRDGEHLALEEPAKRRPVEEYVTQGRQRDEFLSSLGGRVQPYP